MNVQLSVLQHHVSGENTLPKPRLNPRSIFWILLTLTLLVSLCYGISVARRSNSWDSALGYGVLPATQSLMSGDGLTICSSELAQTPGNPICFHSARMPMAEWVMAAAIHIFGFHILPVAIFKIILLLIHWSSQSSLSAPIFPGRPSAGSLCSYCYWLPLR